MTNDLNLRIEDLRKRKISAGTGAEKKAIEVGLGKIIEKIVPAHKDFATQICDCRPLFEPIDMVVFNGLSRGAIKTITFMEIKTGKSKLNAHQKAVKDAVTNHRVDFKVV